MHEFDETLKGLAFVLRKFTDSNSYNVADVLAPAFASAPPIMKEPAITIKPAPDKNKPKKDKVTLRSTSSAS